MLDIPLDQLREMQHSTSHGDDDYDPRLPDDKGEEGEVENPDDKVDDRLDLPEE